MEARELLRESLGSAGARVCVGSPADALEALAERPGALAMLDVAATLLQTSSLREETGLVRQPVYEARYQRVVQAVGAAPTAERSDLEAVIGALMGAPPSAALSHTLESGGQRGSKLATAVAP